ncbi:MAG: hypothetical protein Q7T62_17985 [Undibacterium sp.]|nr:hypothetical protein [Undibacterium sp.]
MKNVEIDGFRVTFEHNEELPGVFFPNGRLINIATNEEGARLSIGRHFNNIVDADNAVIQLARSRINSNTWRN